MSPPPIPASIPPAYSGAPLAYLLPSTSTGTPSAHSGVPPLTLVYASSAPTTQAPPPAHDAACVVALKGNVTTLKSTVNQMAANMAELMALLKGLNRASSSSTSPLAHGLTVDPAPWVPPTHASESNVKASLAPTILQAPIPPYRVDPRFFSENDHHSHLQGAVRVDSITLGPNDYHSHLRGSVRGQEPLTLPQNSIESLRGDVRPDCAVRVDPITLGPNDHHSHLRGLVRSQEPLTLPQNSIGSLRGDVRPDLCQSGSVQFPVGSVKDIWVCARPKLPKPDLTKVQPEFLQSHPVSRN
ncbi:hypothetical protein CRG98_005474 [Punica granatum]|uniref:Uncharacterized protein n=1 Tax=Punica granatum TaxID=22663 RepID=A0A2I0L085_PUNGR|nr:hypothetical protein CRG98_005474 [Punica granatum]